jgi:hypothetical protein
MKTRIKSKRVDAAVQDDDNHILRHDAVEQFESNDRTNTFTYLLTQNSIYVRYQSLIFGINTVLSE